LRFRTLSGALLCSVTVVAGGATSASAASTGGASASPSTPSTTSTPASPAKPAAPLHLSPVTSRSANIAYSGPFYMKSATGAIVPYVPTAVTGQVADATGGVPVAAVAPPAKPELLVPGSRARYVAGLAAAPMSAPPVVQQMVWASNQIIGLPYIWGGGHASFTAAGYDCSGTVSFALHGGALLRTPEDSSEFMHWGSHGIGRWVTIFSNPSHAYMTVAGLRLDTSAADDPSNQQGPRWRPLRRENGGYTVRHPLGL
jgi:cell wall-associated NlpC family hydrolase